MHQNRKAWGGIPIGVAAGAASGDLGALKIEGRNDQPG